MTLVPQSGSGFPVTVILKPSFTIVNHGKGISVEVRATPAPTIERRSEREKTPRASYRFVG